MISIAFALLALAVFEILIVYGWDTVKVFVVEFLDGREEK